MIELRNLFVSYEKKNIIKDASVAIEDGKITSIIGPNGAGKSTLLKAMIGICQTSGDILIDDTSTKDMTRTEIAKKIAFLSQGKNTPDMTVEQMVLHGRFPHIGYPRKYTKKDKDIVSFSLKQMGIDDLAHQNMNTLSGGMRQRAYLAMAFAQDTKYIFCDEPTTYLDISHQLELMNELRTLADSGKGILAVMHDLPLAFHFSDSIIVMKEGTIIEKTTPEKLCKTSLIREIFGVDIQQSAESGHDSYKYEF